MRRTSTGLWTSHVMALATCLGLGVFGCDSDSSTKAAADAGQKDSQESDVPWIPVDPFACPNRCGSGQIYALDHITLLPADSSGVAAGFDLDGLNSDHGDGTGCGFADLKNQYGDAGIDNQFGAILKLLPTQVGDTLPGALATSIAAGGLTVLMEEVGPSGVADNAAPKAVVIRKGLGVPLLGTDGKLLESQSFGLEPDPVLVVMDQLAWDGTGVRGGPHAMKFRMLFVDKNLGFTMRVARMRYESDGKGGIQGEIGGIVTLDEVMGLVGLLGGCDEPLREQLAEVAPSFADSTLEPGGACEGFSMGFSFHGVPAHLLQTARKP